MRDLSTRLKKILAAMPLWWSTAAAAQRVSGVVLDSASRQPVAGVVVRLFDANGRELGRTITSREGRYHLDAAPPARELRAARIGFRPRSVHFSSAIVGDSVVDLVVAALPTLLEAVNVTNQPQCSRRPDRASALALWEQARAALLATIVARESEPPSLTAVVYDRALDPSGRIAYQTVHHDSLPTNRPFIAARAVAEFRELGYAAGSTSERVYFAPDADILLDQSFGDGHCFSLRDDRAHPGQIGLVFEPAKDRDGVIDVDGVMWLDVASPALRTVEFRYTNVEPAVRAADAGGELSFRTASNGVSLIDRWSLHLPSLVQATETRAIGASKLGTDPHVARSIHRPTETRWRVLETHDIGAVIGVARWTDGSEWHASFGTVRGRAVRPDSGAVAGALVWLIGSDDSTRTQADGSFQLSEILPGPYPVFLAEPPADRFGFIQIDSLHLDVDSASSPPLRLVVPTLTGRIHAYCKEQGALLVMGTVLLPDGSKASGASIEGSWMASGADAGTAYRLKARTDTSGAFHVCALRAVSGVRVSVVLDSLDATARDSISLRGDSLLIRWSMRLSVPPYRSRTLAVIDDQSGAPIAGAWVIEDATGEIRATTDARGEASLGWLPRGHSMLVVQRRGYAFAPVTVVIDPKETGDISVALRRNP